MVGGLGQDGEDGEGGSRMTDSLRDFTSGRDELESDKRFERAIAWKGVLTLLVVVLIVVARQWWWA